MLKLTLVRKLKSSDQRIHRQQSSMARRLQGVSSIQCPAENYPRFKPEGMYGAWGWTGWNSPIDFQAYLVLYKPVSLSSVFFTPPPNPTRTSPAAQTRRPLPTRLQIPLHTHRESNCSHPPRLTTHACTRPPVPPCTLRVNGYGSNLTLEAACHPSTGASSSPHPPEPTPNP